ncbi:MAG: tRNA lysidine(34) synthetase TilS [Bacteroidales bacterium]|nr:tRNA lysidine(34) synthetase TilS [Bacteroidales bacterium]
MEVDFNNYLRNDLLLKSSDSVILTVSGGVDSMVMLHLFQKTSFKIRVAHCNFQLRGQESERDMLFVENYCLQNQIEFDIIRFDTEHYAKTHKLSIQMAARELRYNWFSELKSKYQFDFIATAHNLDDLAETFLINLSRGTGLAGLHGIPAQTPSLIRPLLFADRQAISKYASIKNVPFVEDSSNQSTKYLRNKIRHDILPFFTQNNPKFLLNISRLAEYIAKVESFLLNQTDAALNPMIELQEDNIVLDLEQLQQLENHEIYFREFLRGYKFSFATVDLIWQAILTEKCGLWFDSPTFRLFIDRSKIILIPGNVLNNNYLNEDWYISSDLEVLAPMELHCELISEKPSHFSSDSHTIWIDYHKVTFPLKIRRWQHGDYFYPFGMKGKKLLSDFFIDNKISILDKTEIFLLVSNDEIVWIIGMRADNRFRIDTKTQRILKISKQ